MSDNTPREWLSAALDEVSDCASHFDGLNDFRLELSRRAATLRSRAASLSAQETKGERCIKRADVICKDIDMCAQAGSCLNWPEHLKDRPEMGGERVAEHRDGDARDTGPTSGGINSVTRLPPDAPVQDDKESRLFIGMSEEEKEEMYRRPTTEQPRKLPSIPYLQEGRLDQKEPPREFINQREPHRQTVSPPDAPKRIQPPSSCRSWPTCKCTEVCEVRAANATETFIDEAENFIREYHLSSGPRLMGRAARAFDTLAQAWADYKSAGLPTPSPTTEQPQVTTYALGPATPILNYGKSTEQPGHPLVKEARNMITEYREAGHKELPDMCERMADELDQKQRELAQIRSLFATAGETAKEQYEMRQTAERDLAAERLRSAELKIERNRLQVHFSDVPCRNLSRNFTNLENEHIKLIDELSGQKSAAENKCALANERASKLQQQLDTAAGLLRWWVTDFGVTGGVRTGPTNAFLADLLPTEKETGRE